MFIKRSIDKVVVVTVLGASFVVASVRPTSRLRMDMPQEFVDASAPAGGSIQASEQETAKAYWLCATTVIEHEYSAPSQMTLALNPPPEFRIKPASETFDLWPISPLQELFFNMALWCRALNS